MNSAQIVNFSLTSIERRAWLVIKGDREEARVVEMWNGYPNHWTATAWLRPGDYRCRFYCGDENHAVYEGPAQPNGNASDEMDGLVSVTPRNIDKPLKPQAILLVDDNVTTLQACAKLLKDDGYVVHTADGYQSALAIAGTETLDVAICDINLRDGDGCDLLKELKLLQPMKAIAMTGYTLPEETEHYRDAGFGVVLRKPVHHTQITSAILALNGTSAATAEDIASQAN